MDSSGRWRLAYVAHGHTAPGERSRIDLKGLADASYPELVESNRRIMEYGAAQALIDAVGMNMGDFCRGVVGRTEEFYNTRRMTPSELAEIVMDFSRLLVNLLAMFRILLDHTETSFVRQFGKDSSEYAEWKQATKREYDTVFGYRFVYALRNYCLHVGMPPLNISFEDSAIDPRVVFTVNLDRELLLAERSCWKSQLLSDLAELKGNLPVMNLLDDWSGSFWRVAHTILTIQRSAALPAAETTLSYRTVFNLPPLEGEVCAYRIPESERKPESLEMDIFHLHEPLCRKIVEGPSWPREGSTSV
jgi:hypothetical protein